MEIQKYEQNKLAFKLIEGAKYKVIDSYGKEYIVEFEHFKRLANAIFRDGAEFITVNDVIINTRYIYKIEPVKEKTGLYKPFVPKEIAPEDRPKLETIKRTRQALIDKMKM